MFSITNRFFYPLGTGVKLTLSRHYRIRICPALHSKCTFLLHSHRDASERFLKSSTTRRTRNNVGAYSAAWDRALAQRIPRVSLTRAAITKITLPIRTPPPRRLRGSWISGVGMRGIRPCASVTRAHV